MRKYLIIIMAFLAVSCSDANRQYVRKAVRIMDKQGLFAEGDGWESARNEALKAQPASLEEAQEIVRQAAKVAGGKHSFLQLAGSVVADATSQWPEPEVTMQDGGVPVISLPHFSGNHEEGVSYASAVHRFIPSDDKMLRFRTREKTQWIPLSYAVQVALVQQRSRIECPVAILTDSLTASSGEATLICFKGLDYVRVFGEPTAGYASANQLFPLPGGDNLVLTVGCDVARTGEVFCDDSIVPDVLTSTPLEDAL